MNLAGDKLLHFTVLIILNFCQKHESCGRQIVTFDRFDHFELLSETLILRATNCYIWPFWSFGTFVRNMKLAGDKLLHLTVLIILIVRKINLAGDKLSHLTVLIILNFCQKHESCGRQIVTFDRFDHFELLSETWILRATNCYIWSFWSFWTFVRNMNLAGDKLLHLTVLIILNFCQKHESCGRQIVTFDSFDHFELLSETWNLW